MGIVAKLAEGFLMNYISPNLSLIIAIVVGAGVYALLALAMSFKELEAVKSFLTKKKNS